MKRLDNKGATSVLIILLMVVLMVFGLTILTTTLSNKSLSDKKIEWLDDYYALEGKVAVELAAIDHQLEALKKEALSTGADIEILYQENFDLIPIQDGYMIYLEVASEGEDYLKYISVELALDTSKDLSKNNFKIIRYSETQDLFEYEDIKFGNPFFPNED